MNSLLAKEAQALPVLALWLHSQGEPVSSSQTECISLLLLL